MESYYYERGFVKPEDSENEKKNIELRRAFKLLIDYGIQQLYYQKGDGLIGYDHEGTVDGAHPNDLGMLRKAEALQPTIQHILSSNQ